MTYTDLQTLPEDHQLRNTLLVEIGAEFRHPGWLEFRPIEADRPLAADTYNTLKGAWKNFYQWRVPQQDQQNR